MQSPAIDATFSVVETLGVATVPDRVRSLPRRLERPMKGVAILGLVNRGKSTLFNRLLGVDLSAVAETPETAATIAASVGEAFAHGEGETGKDIALPSEPSQFRDTARRDHGAKVSVAWVTGDFRSPAGLTLIDTPGVDDAAVDFEDALVHLPDQWRNSGASAAIVVLSYPPGPSSRDRRLIVHAQEAFPSAVSIVLKPTSSGVEWEDLLEVVREAEAALDVPVLLLPDELAKGPWGHGPYAQLEQEIDRIASVGANRLSSDLAAFERFFDEVLHGVTETSLADVPAIAEVLEDTRHLPSKLKTALREQHDRLKKQQIDEQRRSDATVRKQRLKVLDSTAVRLQATLRSMQTQGDHQGAKQIYREFLGLANEGSPTAIRELERVAVSKASLKNAGVNLEAVLAALPDERATAAIEATKLEPRTLLGTLRHSNLTVVVREAIERRVLQLVDEAAAAQPSDITTCLNFATELADLASVDDVRLGAAELEGHLALKHLRSVTNVTIDGLVTWHATWTATQAATKTIERHQRRPLPEVVQSDQVRDIVAELAQRAAGPIRVALAQRYTVKVIHPGAWEAETTTVEQAAETILRLATRTQDPCAALRQDFEASQRGRELWKQASIERAHEGYEQHRQVVRRWDLAFYGSFVLWFFAFVLSLGDGSLAFVVWLVSFVLWLVSRRYRTTLREGDWLRRVQIPASPVLAAPYLPEAGWYPDPFTDAPRNRWWTGFHWAHVVSPTDGWLPAVDGSFDRAVPHGWLPDPWQRGRWRWWGGVTWSEATLSH